MARYEEIARRLREDTPYYAEHLLKIADKRGEIVPLAPSKAQLACDAKLEAQRAAGKPMRAIILKARQIGMSTWIQGKIIQRTTQRPNYNAVVVAHDRDTGQKLYRIGERMYSNLPDDPAIRPDLASHRRSRSLHFANGGRDAWLKGGAWPDSTYLVDTAGEFQAGRGGTYQAVHASEIAFWDDIITKLTALKNAVPRDPESLFVLESTANGNNVFKDLWDDAVEGHSEYVPFFWPWWKEEQYSLPFANEAEREAFRPGDTGQSPYATDEPKLLEPGPIDTDTNKHVPLTLEQLHWRRVTIANECSGQMDMFHQEYPATPQEAFVASARQVFDADLVRGVLLETSLSDPREPSADHPGPNRGLLTAKSHTERRGRSGTIEVPEAPLWTPAHKLTLGQSPEWKIWGPAKPRTEGQYVVGADVSGGEVEAERGESAYHAIQVVDQRERVQQAEYRSRIDPDLLAEQLYLAALLFNKAWIAVEVTGGWGLPVARKIWMDYRYPYLYFQQKPDTRTERKEHRLGWDTNKKTLPIIVANMAEQLREGIHGIRSRTLALELSTYVRNERGKMGPEPGKFSDLLMAYMIAQQVAGELPVKHDRPIQSYRPRDPVTGY